MQTDLEEAPMNNEPRMRDLYQEYLHGRVSFEHLVETANRFLVRWEAEQAAIEANMVESQTTEPGS